MVLDAIAATQQGKQRRLFGHMPDDFTNKGPQDRSRISLLEPHEVQYWADKFNVSKERLSEAVRNVGGAFCGRRRKRTEKISLGSRDAIPWGILGSAARAR